MKVSRLVSLVVEVAIYIAVIVAWRRAKYWVPQAKRGFFCGDPAFSLPYKKMTIPISYLYVNVFAVPAIMWLVELYQQSIKDEKEMFKTVKAVTWRVLLWFKNYFFTFMTAMILMDTIKNLKGALRPFFFDLCQPDLGANCIKGSFVSSDFKCTNPNVSEKYHNESRKSFPSGHVMASAYASLFLMWYLHKRLSRFPVLVTFLHLICLLWITICSVTRITDNWHHPVDVLGGFVLVLPFVFYGCNVSCRNFKVPMKSAKTNDVDLNQD